MDKVDQFDRQKRIKNWDQKVIEQQSVLILGVGGLGSCVIQQLLRIGIPKLFLVDYDKVEIHNLNRQNLFTNEDIGQYKVDAALKNAKFHNIGNSQLEGFNIDALKNWPKIVELAKQSTAVFNLIDHGDYWDSAVQSLCLKLKLPLFYGGCYYNTISVDYSCPTGKPCNLCLTELDSKYIVQITPDKICDIKDLSFLPPNNKPVGITHSMLCTTTSCILANYYKLFLFDKGWAYHSKRQLFYLDELEQVKFDIYKNNFCAFCGGDIGQPSSGGQLESTIINAPINELWEKVKYLQFNKLFPEFVESCTPEKDAVLGCGFQTTIKFKDNTVWVVRISEISSLNYFVSYEIISAIPETHTFSALNTIRLQKVTQDDSTFFEWETEFSNDVTQNIIEDNKFKKRDNFASLKKVYSNKK